MRLLHRMGIANLSSLGPKDKIVNCDIPDVIPWTRMAIAMVSVFGLEWL